MMQQGFRYYAAGCLMTATIITTLTIVDTNWKAAVLLVFGFAVGAMWFGLIGADFLAAVRGGLGDDGKAKEQSGCSQ